MLPALRMTRGGMPADGASEVSDRQPVRLTDPRGAGARRGSDAGYLREAEVTGVTPQWSPRLPMNPGQIMANTTTETIAGEEALAPIAARPVGHADGLGRTGGLRVRQPAAALAY